MTTKHTITRTQTIEIVDCGICSVPIALTTTRYTEARENGSWFYCSNGHLVHYTETENMRLRHQLDHAQELANREAEKRRRKETELADLLKKHTRLTRNGVCPYCRRNFHRVATHIRMKHPEATQGMPEPEKKWDVI